MEDGRLHCLAISWDPQHKCRLGETTRFLTLVYQPQKSFPIELCYAYWCGILRSVREGHAGPVLSVVCEQHKGLIEHIVKSTPRLCLFTQHWKWSYGISVRVSLPPTLEMWRLLYISGGLKAIRSTSDYVQNRERVTGYSSVDPMEIKSKMGYIWLPLHICGNPGTRVETSYRTDSERWSAKLNPHSKGVLKAQSIAAASGLGVSSRKGMKMATWRHLVLVNM